MGKQHNIYLIGPMGAGKTTIGRQLAKELKKPFYDSDAVIIKKTEVDIATIFKFEGELGFRKREAAVIKKLTQMQNIVLATGGGVISNEENCKLLKSKGVVIYLYCSVDILLARTKNNKQRPLLQTSNPRERIEQLLATRDPLYAACADFKIRTESLARKVVVKKILTKYKSLVG